MSDDERWFPGSDDPLQESAAEWVTAASTAALAVNQIYNTVRPPRPPDRPPPDPPQPPHVELPPGVERE